MRASNNNTKTDISIINPIKFYDEMTSPNELSIYSQRRSILQKTPSRTRVIINDSKEKETTNEYFIPGVKKELKETSI